MSIYSPPDTYRAFTQYLILITASILLFSLTVSAQVDQGMEAQQNMNALGGASNTVRTYDTRYAGVKGTPFFLPVWTTGNVTMNDRKTYTNIPLKHDVYQNQVVMKRPQGDSVIINSHSFNQFSLNDVAAGKEYLFRKYPGLKSDDPSLKDEFFEVLYEGKTALLVKHDKTLVKADYQGAYGAGRAYDELVSKQDYYLKNADQTVIKLKMNRKALLEALPHYRAEVKAYADQEKIDFKDLAAVAKLLAYYDSLLEK